MRELVLFYSYSGRTRKAAEAFGEENGFDVCEVVARKKPSKLYAYSVGCFKAMKGGVLPIEPLTVKDDAVRFEDYDAVDVFAPIWASHTAPAMNSAVQLLPGGTKIRLNMVSASGKSNQELITKRLQDLGLEVIGYNDMKM